MLLLAEYIHDIYGKLRLACQWPIALSIISRAAWEAQYRASLSTMLPVHITQLVSHLSYEPTIPHALLTIIYQLFHIRIISSSNTPANDTLLS